MHSTQDTPVLHEQVRNWFESFIDELQIHLLTLETKTASKTRKEFYDTLIFGNELEVVALANDLAKITLVKNIVGDYLSELKDRKKFPKRLALNFSNSKVLVWAEIRNDDEATEDALILTEAKVNSKYNKYDFNVSSTIVEESDKLKIPDHYKAVRLKS